jgi:hypothetical protein
VPANGRVATQKLAPDPRLNPRLKRHIKSLGLRSVPDYQDWCKQNGFKPSLSKNLDQLREEISASKKSGRLEERRRALAKHLTELGFKTEDDYRGWCRGEGLGDGLYKSESQREKEKKRRAATGFEESLARRKHRRRHLEETVGLIAAGRISGRKLADPVLKRIGGFLNDEHETSRARKAFIAHLLPMVDFLDTNPVIESFGSRAGNTCLDGLFALSRHHEKWIRPAARWKPRRRSLLGRFGELARHLLARYEVPDFMDTAWFSGSSAEARRQQNWFIHLGMGGNIRKANDLPLAYTKAMAHLFLRAPSRCTINQALRWGQILALGGTRQLADHINATQLGEGFENESFWVSVVHFFINHPMLDFDTIGPIIDYIQHRKFTEREEIDAGGARRLTGPPEPQFSMKGRTVRPLLERVDEWHARLAKERRSPKHAWSRSDIPEFERMEEDRATGRIYRWTIRELLSRKEVVEEGRAMHHCVASYIDACAKGKKSVWSMRMEDIETGLERRIMTIAVKNRTVVQARGRCNVLPGVNTTRSGVRQSSQEKERLKRGRSLMMSWGYREAITVPHHT